MFQEKVSLAEISAGHTADMDELTASINGNRRLMSGILGSLIPFAIAISFYTNVQSLLFTLVACLMGVGLLVNGILSYRRARLWLQVNSDGMILYGRVLYRWEYIEEVYGNKSAIENKVSELIIELRDKKKIEFEIHNDMDPHIGIVAAYICKFHQQPAEV